MKRKAIFLGGPIAILLLLAAGFGLLRFYLAEAAELLVAKYTDAGASIERIDIGFLPPCITVHGLSLDTGADKVYAPLTTLYPDLSRVMQGEVGLERAVLDKPLIRTAPSDGGSSGFDPALLPRSLTIRNASFTLDDDGAQPTPITVSADVTKAEPGLAFAVKNASIPEFGLTFNGTVDMRSFEPFQVAVDASQGTFDPSRLIDFLRRFGYLGETKLAVMAGTHQIAATNFRLRFDAKTREVSFAADTLAVDGSTLTNFAVNVDAKGGWSLACARGSLDSAQLLSLVRAHPDGGAALAGGLKGLGLGSLDADGTLAVRDVAIKSRRGAAGASGSISLASPSLRLSLTSVKGEKQDMTLKGLDGTITLENGKPMVRVNKMEISSSAGGGGFVSGESPLPFALAGARFQAEARQLNWFGKILDGTVAKKEARQIDFALDLLDGGTRIKAKGLVRNEFGGNNRWAGVLDDLTITTENTPGDDQPFDFAFVRDGGPSGKIVVRRLQYNDLPVVMNLSATLSSAKGKTVVKGTGRLCLMLVGLEMLLTPDTLAANVAVKGNGVHLTGVLGCFVNELPVYLRGRLTIQGTFFSKGQSARQVRDSLRGDVLVRLRELDVLKLSNLDKRLGFFIELMNAAELDPGKGDALSFREGMVAARILGDAIELDAARLNGPQMAVAGKGHFDMKDKRLHMDAHVTTPLGISTDTVIDQILSSGDGQEKE